MLVIVALFGLCVALAIAMVPLAICGPAFAESRLRTKLAVQCVWWPLTVLAMVGASGWWRENPESAFRTALAVGAGIAMPALGVVMLVRTVAPPREAVATPWYLRRRPRAQAGSGALRNARLRRD